MTTITTTEDQVIVTGDYNAEFVEQARKLAGKWKNPSWVFDIRNEDAVRKACLECYGTDGLVTDLVDVRITFPDGFESPYCESINVFGRTVARAFGRDSGARPGDGIVLEEGGFSSGGSSRNWLTKAKSGTKVVMRDVSRRLVEANADKDVLLEIIGSTSDIDRDALAAEREKLVARITEIDAQLAA